MAKEILAELKTICDKIRKEFDKKDAGREKGSRQID